MTDAEFGNLAYTSRYRILVAVGAGAGVIDRTQTFIDAIGLLKGCLILCKSFPGN